MNGVEMGMNPKPPEECHKPNPPLAPPWMNKNPSRWIQETDTDELDMATEDAALDAELAAKNAERN